MYVDAFSGEGVVKAFPDMSDDDLPTQPIDMRMTPDGTKWWVAGLEGEIVEVSLVRKRFDYNRASGANI